MPGDHDRARGGASDGTGSHLTDSAGQPWEGRHLEVPAFAGDDGTAPPVLLEALRRFRAREVGYGDVVAALSGTRLLVPLLAMLGEATTGPHGRPVEKSAEMAIVTVEGRDGRRVLPAFSSVAALSAWNPRARPVPVEAERVAVAAAAEGTDLVVLDPRSDTEFGLRRSALEALARGTAWRAPWHDPDIVDAVARSVVEERAVAAVDLVAGDPDAALSGAELAVRLELRPGLDQEALDALLGRLGRRWADDGAMAAVDGISIILATASGG